MSCSCTSVLACIQICFFIYFYTDWYKTDQLCPDLQEAVAGKDIDTANLPYKSVFRFIDNLPSVRESYADLPCILEANGPQRILSTALIEAIHVDNRPWNYSGAQTCEEHIKLRLPEPTFLKRNGNVPKIICRIPKSRATSKEATGSLYHPYIWQFQKGKLGLSFSSLNLSLIQQTNWNSVTNANNDSSRGSQYWLEPDPYGNQFVQIVFTTRFGGSCTVRVQQYMIDTQKTLCEGAKQRNFRLCGLYDCEEKESILRTLGFWTHRKEHEQLHILLQSEISRWRREDPSYLEILVSTLRALIMPLLFLSVFYITRRLRLKLASRNASRNGVDRHRNVLRQRQCYLRSLMREGNTSSSSESSDMLRPSLLLNHVVYDIPVNDYPGYEDLPPPYDSIVQPPSYHEATTTVKTNLPSETLPSNQSNSSTQELLSNACVGVAGEESNDERNLSNDDCNEHSTFQQDSVMMEYGIDEERVRLVNPASSPSPTQASHNLST
ncbi:unnamed protein product [Orchesella dallaii]|uniref:Uncharacterized protein n=1 Tax=Orchesella dallaii TaxID=48710 RepID=A0ABP1PTR1_9HEXA